MSETYENNTKSSHSLLFYFVRAVTYESKSNFCLRGLESSPSIWVGTKD